MPLVGKRLFLRKSTIWESSCTIIRSRLIRVEPHCVRREADPARARRRRHGGRRHREQPYLSLNPYGRVPTLEEDGFVLYESTAILNYLEATQPNPALVPADARGRALVDMRMKLCDLQLSR